MPEVGSLASNHAATSASLRRLSGAQDLLLCGSERTLRRCRQRPTMPTCARSPTNLDMRANWQCPGGDEGADCSHGRIVSVLRLREAQWCLRLDGRQAPIGKGPPLVRAVQRGGIVVLRAVVLPPRHRAQVVRTSLRQVRRSTVVARVRGRDGGVPRGGHPARWAAGRQRADRDSIVGSR